MAELSAADRALLQQAQEQANGEGLCVGCGHHASGPVGALRDKQGNAVGSDATDKRLAASA